jgi:hypothetical protein
MRFLKKFLADKKGSIAIQFSIAAMPLIAVGGVGIDYSRISVAKAGLQSTLDQNISNLKPSAFSNRKQMEAYIVSLAGVNMESKTITADITIKENVLRVSLKDTIKTPALSLMGRPEFEVLASVDIKYEPQTSTTTIVSRAPNISSKPYLSRTQINQQIASTRERIKRINASKYISSQRKRQIVSRLNKHLQRLRSM